MEDKPVAPPLELTFAFDNEIFSDAQLDIVEEESVRPTSFAARSLASHRRGTRLSVLTII